MQIYFAFSNTMYLILFMQKEQSCGVPNSKPKYLFTVVWEPNKAARVLRCTPVLGWFRVWRRKLNFAGITYLQLTAGWRIFHCPLKGCAQPSNGPTSYLTHLGWICVNVLSFTPQNNNIHDFKIIWSFDRYLPGLIFYSQNDFLC